jgi:hypothetical protein
LTALEAESPQGDEAIRQLLTSAVVEEFRKTSDRFKSPIFVPRFAR